MTKKTGQLSFRLHILMAENRITLREISEETGLSIANLSKIKRGDAEVIKLSTLQKLHDAYGWGPEVLIRVE